MQTTVDATRWMKTHIAELNLFKSEATRSDAVKLRIAIISTRFYIVLFTVAIMILVVFTALEGQLQITTIENPSQAIFEELFSKYSDVLQCPCNKIDIPYDTFFNISYKLHPVCSSVFVSDIWINLLFSPLIGYYFPVDFRSSASGQFQILATLCSFINRTLQDAIDDLSSSFLVSFDTISSQSLDEKSKAQTLFWQTSTINAFRRLFDLVRSATQCNSLQPALQTSTMHLLHVFKNGSIDIYPLAVIWQVNSTQECYCNVQPDCSVQSGFYNQFGKETEGYFQIGRGSKLMANVTGFVAGCYAHESLRKSTLECFFDPSCLNTVLKYFPPSNITSLDILKTNQTQYTPQTTIEILINNIFLETWSSEYSYSAYYSQCAPISCTYKFTRHNNALYVLTTLLGLYGGLTFTLRLVIPFVVGWWQRRKNKSRVEPNQPIGLIERWRTLWQWIRIKLMELNLFKTAATNADPFKLRTAIIATRLYLFLMLLSMIIIAIYVLSSVRMQSVTIQNPSQTTFQNLYNKYPSTLRCPCSTIIIPYESFALISPEFHPVCSSPLISVSWIAFLTSLNVKNSLFDITDFQVSGETFFDALATLCSFSQTTVNNSWYVFSKTPLITDMALPETEFKTRTKAALGQFEKNTISDFTLALNMIEAHTRSTYATGFQELFLYTNQLSNTTTPIDFNWMPAGTNTCSCAIDDECLSMMAFYNYTDNTVYNPFYLKFTLPHIYVGCFVISSLRLSTLECFFNETCLSMVTEEIHLVNNQNYIISILQTNTTRFSPETPIGTLINNLMLETWNETIQYDKYYKYCAPEQCTFTFTSHNNPLEVFTTIVGLFGGLSVALRIIAPFVVSFIRNRMHRSISNTNITTGRPSLINRVHGAWSSLRTKMLTLNLFETEASWCDPVHRRKEIITTRFYLLLLLVSVIILTFYNTFTTTQLVTIHNPSEATFDKLRFNPHYSPTLECPCQNIAIPYNSFILIKPYYHQLCSSNFVINNYNWLNLILPAWGNGEYSYDDFHLFALPQFNLLNALCILANETLGEAIDLFTTNIMISERVEFREAIENQTNVILEQFRISTCRSFVRTLDLIRNIAQGNGIVSSILSNWHFHTLNTTFRMYLRYPVAWPQPLSYGNDNCSCGTNAMCSSQAMMDGLVVSGFRVGCYPLEALLQSTLECLYNVSCIDMLRFMFGPSNFTVDPLNSTLSFPNATVQSLVDVLFIDYWETSVIYSQYYTTCSPSMCTYRIKPKLYSLYIVTKIIGLLGGLTVFLKLVVPILVTIGLFLITCHRQKVGPGTVVVAQ